MLREFFLSGRRFDRLVAWFGLAVIIGHSIFSAYIKFAINSWYTVFYDLLQTSGQQLVQNSTLAPSNATATSLALETSREKVWQQLLSFFRIVAPAVIIHPASRWVRSHWALRWRMCLMRSYMDQWDPNTAPIEGASQRVHEDTQRFSKGIDSYLTIVLNSLCTLAAFTPILLSLGGRIVAPSSSLQLFGRAWMFASALASALIGLGVAMLAGRKLVGLEVANQRVEAELRRELVVLEATPETICGVGSPPERSPVGAAKKGEPNGEAESAVGALSQLLPPAPHFGRIWSDLMANYGSLYANFLGLNLWLDGFDQVMVLAPYVLVAPRLFAESPAERISLGTLVQTANSFDKVFASLSIISENWGGINEWRSTFVRLRQFEERQRSQSGSSCGSSAVSDGPMSSDSETSLLAPSTSRP